MTHSKTFPAAACLGLVSAALLGGASAVAQTDTAGTDASGAGSSADQITCAELTQMDTAVVPGTLYFVAGYHRGMSDSMNLSESAGTGGTASSAGTDMSTDATGTDSTATDTATAEGTGEETAGTSETADAADTAGATDGEMGDAAQIGRLTGYFEIPIERVMTVCGETPDRPVSDVVEEQRGMNGSESN